MISVTWIPLLRIVSTIIAIFPIIYIPYYLAEEVEEKNIVGKIGCCYPFLFPVMFWFWFSGYPDTHCEDVVSFPVFCYRFMFGNSFMGFVAGVYMIIPLSIVLFFIVCGVVSAVKKDQ